MESCYVPNNPNFASTAASSAAVDQWTPPSPTSPPVSAPDSSKQVEQHVYHHDSVIQQLCCDSSDLIVVNTAVSASSANDPSGASQHHHTLTSLSALPPVQELLAPCRNNSDVTVNGNHQNLINNKDPFSSYSLTALDFEPLPGFLTLSSCTSYKDRSHQQDMSDLPFKSSGGSTSSAGNYGSIYTSQHSPQHQSGAMSPFSAAVAAATQHQQQIPSHQIQQHHQQQQQQQQQQCQSYSFQQTSSGSNQKMSHHHHQHGHHHHQTATYPQDANNYGNTTGACTSGLFPSMSVNVSMNMTMGMGMSMGPMSYGIETGTPIQCWNGHNGPSIHHLPGVAAAAAAAAAASVNPASSTYPPAQALLSPIQVSYNSNIYPTSFTPSSANGYCLSGDWRPPATTNESSGLYELKELKEASSPLFGSGRNSYHHSSGSKSRGIVQQQHGYSQHQYSSLSAEGYSHSSMTSVAGGSISPVVTVIKKRSSKQTTATAASLSSSSIDYDMVEEMHESCGSAGSNSTVGSGPPSGGCGQGKANLCRVCGKTYARPSTLKTHMRTHSGERPYRCGDCHKSFSQAANLTAHVRTHSGEKPFRCQICDRRFSQSSSVTTHMRTHSGERPYRCRMCKKAFSDSSTLTKHMRIHSGEKPYQCKLCLLRFSQSGNLNRHMRVHSATS